MVTMYDVVIIGSGVSGTASARELSRYEGKICVVEKEEDVCCGTSKANSAIIHAGYDAQEGSLMAKLNVRGNELMGKLSEDLDILFERIGSLVVCLSEEDMPGLKALYDRGIANGVKDLRILDRKEVHEMEPNLTAEVCAALYAPTAGIVCPFGLNLALAENACENGVEFKFNTEVKGIRRLEYGWELLTDRGNIRTRAVVNAAGVYADYFHNMVSERKIHITPRRGEYCLLDKTAGEHVKHTIFALPGKYGKGILDSSRIKIVMQMEEQEARLVQNVLNLSEEEVRQITRFRRGEGLLCIGYNHVPIAFYATQKEYDAITTSPTDLLNRNIKNETV